MTWSYFHSGISNDWSKVSGAQIWLVDRWSIFQQIPLHLSSFSTTNTFSWGLDTSLWLRGEVSTMSDVLPLTISYWFWGVLGAQGRPLQNKFPVCSSVYSSCGLCFIHSWRSCKKLSLFCASWISSNINGLVRRLASFSPTINNSNFTISMSNSLEVFATSLVFFWIFYSLYNLVCLIRVIVDSEFIVRKEF